MKIPVITRQLRMYVLIGVSAFLTEFLSFLIFFNSIILEGEYRLIAAQSISFCFGLTVSFAGNRYVTFKRDESNYKHHIAKQIGSVLSLGLVNLLLSNVLISVLVTDLNFPAFVAKLIAMACVVSWTYLIFNRYIFKTK